MSYLVTPTSRNLDVFSCLETEVCPSGSLGGLDYKGTAIDKLGYNKAWLGQHLRA